MKKYYLYILECFDQTFYTGITTDLVRRLEEHNSSKLGAKYTKIRRPLKLVYSQEFRNRSEATKEEARIKKLTRLEKLAIIGQTKVMKIENLKKIDSLQNNQIKLLKKLNLKKYREESGQFLVENLTIIYDALKDGYDFEALFVTPEFIRKNEEKLNYLLNNSRALNFYLVDEKINKFYSSLDTPSGISAVYKINYKPLDKSSVIYLNGVSDPGNLGTIMRSALAFNFNNLVLDENCVDIYNPKVITAAKDAIFKLNFFETKNREWLKKNKLPVYITSSHSGSDLDKFKPAKDFCLVLGGESHGVDIEIVKIAKQSLKIEMSSKIESLNVATAAAILLYELRKNI